MARTRVRAGDAEILREAKDRFERCVAWETQARQNALADAKFAAGDIYNLWQWDDSVRAGRGNRPCLTMNKVRQHNLQIVNDARQHKAQIKVTPVGGRATYEAAQVFSGIVRRIEYQSKAVDAYSTAIFHQVESGIGYVRVLLDYADEQSMDEEIFIRRVANPRSVYLDPDAKDYDKSDMNFAFVFADIPRDRFEAQHGKEEAPAPATLDHPDGWNDKDHIREAEYWRRTDENDTLHKLIDGTVFKESDLEDGEMDRLEPFIKASRDISEPTIEWFLLRGNRVAERREWKGRYIPIVPFIGEETVIENRMDRKGHTRALIDAQRMYNYWNSAAVEHVALQTKTPFIASLRAVDGVQQEWDQANVSNKGYLPYNDIDETGRPIERPERSQPPAMADAYIKGMTISRDDMLMVSGQYQAEFGQPSNERSGVAIDARQRQSDNATAHYVDNQAKGIRQVGRIVLDLIPKVYDTERVMKIMAEDGTDSDVHLDPNAPIAHQHVAMTPGGPQPITPGQAKQSDDDEKSPLDVRVIFNPNVGRYDIEADVGPSYGTRRQEAFNAFSQIMAQNQAAFQVVGDFWAQNADFPGADELADRLKRGLPPQYKPGPSPQEQQLQQQLQQTTQTAQQMLQKADAEISMLKAMHVHLQEEMQSKHADTAIDEYKAETDRLKAVGTIDPVALQMIVRQMVADMLGTQIVHPQVLAHAQDQSEIQQTLAPPPPPDGANGAGGAPQPSNGAGAGP
jgi:hypothetical protein